jgi:septal ring factor EnvC (AmiA/AmiB activator)
MLPLLEGNVVSAATNLLANRPMHEVDLKPLEDAISRLQTEHRALAFHSGEQKRALQHLEDDFAAVQEAVQKNAADQAELIEHVAKLAKRTSSFMRLVTILLVVSILFTALLCVRIAYLIRF